MVKLVEPSRLTKVWALTARLIVQELEGLILLWRRREAQLVRFVISVDEVFNDGAGLPEGDAGIGVFDGGDAAPDF